MEVLADTIAPVHLLPVLAFFLQQSVLWKKVCQQKYEKEQQHTWLFND
jgi:hypothetical protein